MTTPTVKEVECCSTHLAIGMPKLPSSWNGEQIIDRAVAPFGNEIKRVSVFESGEICVTKG